MITPRARRLAIFGIGVIALCDLLAAPRKLPPASRRDRHRHRTHLGHHPRRSRRHRGTNLLAALRGTRNPRGRRRPRKERRQDRPLQDQGHRRQNRLDRIQARRPRPDPHLNPHRRPLLRPPAAPSRRRRRSKHRSHRPREPQQPRHHAPPNAHRPQPAPRPLRRRHPRPKHGLRFGLIERSTPPIQTPHRNPRRQLLVICPAPSA